MEISLKIKCSGDPAWSPVLLVVVTTLHGYPFFNCGLTNWSAITYTLFIFVLSNLYNTPIAFKYDRYFVCNICSDVRTNAATLYYLPLYKLILTIIFILS